MYRSIFSFSSMTKLPSTKIGGGVESYFDLKLGGGLCISTVVTWKAEKRKRKRKRKRRKRRKKKEKVEKKKRT